MAKQNPDKLIITNGAQLKKKYTAAGKAVIDTAVKKLIKADNDRNIVTRYIDLSNAAQMTLFGAKAVSAASAGNAKLNKQAIDKIFKSFEVRPSYVTLLGSHDVIPHVRLDNPVRDDEDPDVPSDLPYACDTPYGTDIQDFVAPTRVVGRLPDVTGGSDAAYLKGLLATAANYTPRPASDYSDFLGISAHVWRKSSELSLDAVFGSHAGLKISPPDGPRWSAAEAKRLAHFVNCHGAPADPNFYGQKGRSMPEAHSASWMQGKTVEATVMAAECCYGAELYDPALPSAGGQMGMCNTYLTREAYAYFGSSNIAYGPSDEVDWADLMCQYFLLAILDGASAGRACLQARLRYVNDKGGVLKPVDLKTLAQFNLMADSSLTPVAGTPRTVVAATAGAKSLRIAEAAVARHDRIRRRVVLEELAAITTPLWLLGPTTLAKGAKTSLAGQLDKVAAEHGIKTPHAKVTWQFGAAHSPSGAKGIKLRNVPEKPAPKAVHVILERRKPPRQTPQIILVRGVQVVEYEDGMSVKVFESR